ncbi:MULTISPECIES: hypothetical protein [Persicobacter]|uniref:Uncharacterized protein n=1 Tax=Persicobacter diffluens TaxID=981 RepID=A0AAN4VWH4_9BACT|nr:hypothetical protein [Persicobacter sp. CCB-QB2]GJM60316.1 hypothetical protein PEDI_08680 [Persicobacter diffluens]
MKYTHLKGLSFERQASIIMDEGTCISRVNAADLEISLYRLEADYIEVWSCRKSGKVNRVIETAFELIDPCLKHFLKIHSN